MENLSGSHTFTHLYLSVLDCSVYLGIVIIVSLSFLRIMYLGIIW